jgi:hypothetical protein
MNMTMYCKACLRLFLLFAMMLLLESCGGGGNNQTLSEPVTGTFRDSIVQGIRYVAKAQDGRVQEGVTNDSGQYTYFEGGTIDFFVGNIILASVNNPTATIVTAFLAQEPAATNIARFLQTLDEDNDPTNGIVIPETVQLRALSFNKTQLDFSATTFDEQFAALKQDLLSGSGIPSSRSLVSNDAASTHAENSARLAFLSETRLGKAIEGKLAYTVSYNVEVLNKSGSW